MYIEVDEQGNLKIFGKLSIDNMPEFSERLNTFLLSRNKLVLDLSEVIQLDLPCINMLCQLKKKALLLSKEIKILINNSSTLNTVLKESELKIFLS